MKNALVAAALIVAGLGLGSSATAHSHQPAAGHRQLSASVAPDDLGWGNSPTTAPSDLGWGGGAASLSV